MRAETKHLYVQACIFSLRTPKASPEGPAQASFADKLARIRVGSVVTTKEHFAGWGLTNGFFMGVRKVVRLGGCRGNIPNVELAN